MNAQAIFAALAKYKGVDLDHPNVEDMREIQSEARDFGVNLEFDEIRMALEEAGKFVAEGTKKRYEKDQK